MWSLLLQSHSFPYLHESLTKYFVQTTSEILKTFLCTVYMKIRLAGPMRIAVICEVEKFKSIEERSPQNVDCEMSHRAISPVDELIDEEELQQLPISSTTVQTHTGQSEELWPLKHCHEDDDVKTFKVDVEGDLNS